jgi:SEFIR domain
MRSVFISYRHENKAHATAVRAFAERLRNEQFPVELDQFYLMENPGGPNEGWPEWCRDRAVKAECVLVIASPGWFQAYESEGEPGQGLGAAEEARIFSQAIYREKGISPRIRFVILETSGVVEFPYGLDAWHKFNLPENADDFALIVAWVRQKLSIPIPAQPPRRFVYLAECLIDSDGLREGLQEELKYSGWNVLPDSNGRSYGGADYAGCVAEDMRRAIAFVQILQPVRWKGLDRDYIQNQQAVKTGIPRIRFRSPDLNCATISDETHRDFLTSDPTVIARPFDQFKKELFEKMSELWDRLHQPPVPPAGNSGAKLVRIVDRSSDAETNWVKVFPSFDTALDIIHDRVKTYEFEQKPLSIKQRTKPCHGFLIVCDASALTDPCFSPDGPLEECQEIQLALKDNTRCPPVGVVYWPPPPDKEAWPRLLSFRPLKLHKVLGNDHAVNIADFLEEVRRLPV